MPSPTEAVPTQRRVVAITGAHGALGRAVASTFRQQGAIVCRIDRSSPSSPAIASDDELDLHGVDIADATAARDAFEQIASRYGRLDVLVNVAGGFEWETVGEGSLDTWDRLYTMNLRTAVSASQAALPLLRRETAAHAAIVNIAAAASTRATSGMGAYSASKAGVLRFTEALADETKRSRLTVNAILPTILDTPRNREDMPDADFASWVTVDDIAGIVVFLASPAAAAITGAGILVGARAL